MRHYRPQRLWLLLIALVALAFSFRLLHLWAVSDTPWIERYLTAPTVDDYSFFKWAQTILAGDWLGRDTYHPYFEWMGRVADLEDWHKWWGGKEVFHQTPLYPYMLAVWLAIYNGSVSLVFVTQLFLGSLQVLIIYFLGTRLFDYRVGLVAGLITALYGPFIFYQTTLLRDWLVPVLEPLAVLALLKAGTNDRPLAWGMSGATLGIAVLCKPTALTLVLVGFAWIVFHYWRQWRQTGRALSSAIIGLVLVFTPLLIRNAVVGAPLFALSTRAVEAFVFANTDNTTATVRKVFKRSRGDLSRAIWETMNLNVKGPSSFLWNQVNKMGVLVRAHEDPNNTSFDYGREISPILRWTVDYSFVFSLGIVGLMMCLQTWRHHLLAFLYGIASVVGVFVTSPISRYRLAVVPVLILYGAAVLIHWVDDIREQRLWHALGITGLVMIVALMQLVVLAKTQPTYSHDYYNSAMAYRKQNNFKKAVHELSTLSRKLMRESSISRAAYEATGMEGDYRVAWAKNLLREEKIALAKEQVELADAAYAKDPNLVLSHYNVGILYAGVGESEKARKSLEQFLRVAPKSPKAARARNLLSQIAKQPEASPTE